MSAYLGDPVNFVRRMKLAKLSIPYGFALVNEMHDYLSGTFFFVVFKKRHLAYIEADLQKRPEAMATALV